MDTPNRVMRFKNNPNARGFIVYVMQELYGPFGMNGELRFQTIATRTAGTKKKCDEICMSMKAEFNAR